MEEIFKRDREGTLAAYQSDPGVEFEAGATLVDTTTLYLRTTCRAHQAAESRF